MSNELEHKGTRPRIDVLHSKYILFAQKISKSVMNVSEITFYQAAKGRQMMEKCIQQGFQILNIIFKNGL